MYFLRFGGGSEAPAAVVGVCLGARWDAGSLARPRGRPRVGRRGVDGDLFISLAVMSRFLSRSRRLLRP